MRIDLLSRRNLLIIAILWLGVCFGINGVFHDRSLASHQVLVSCTLASYVMCIFNWVKCGNRALSLYNFFVLYMMLSNLGQSILFLFGFPGDYMIVYSRYSLDQINELLRFQLLCVAGLNLGTML